MGLIYTAIMDHQRESAYDGTKLDFRLWVDEDTKITHALSVPNRGDIFDCDGIRVDVDRNVVLRIELDIDYTCIMVYYVKETEMDFDRAKEFFGSVHPDHIYRFAGKYSSSKLLIFDGINIEEDQIDKDIREHEKRAAEQNNDAYVNDGPDLQQEYASPEDVYAEQGVGFEE